SRSFSRIGCAPGGSLKGGVPSIAIASLADGAEAELLAPEPEAAVALAERRGCVEDDVVDRVRAGSGHRDRAGAGRAGHGRSRLIGTEDVRGGGHEGRHTAGRDGRRAGRERLAPDAGTRAEGLELEVRVVEGKGRC